MVQFYAWLESLKAEKAEGQGMVEYALILVLVSIAAIIALGLLGTQVSAVFNEITGALGF